MVFVSFFTANTSVEVVLPEYVSGDESTVLVCDHTDLLQKVSAHGSSTVIVFSCTSGTTEVSG